MNMMFSVVINILLLMTSLHASESLKKIKIETVLPVTKATKSTDEFELNLIKRDTNTEVMSNFLAGYSDLAIINVDQLALLVKATYGQDDLIGKVKEHKYYLVSKQNNKSTIKNVGFLKGHFEEYFLKQDFKLKGIEMTMAEKILWTENKLDKQVDAIILSEEYLELSRGLITKELKKNNWFIVANDSVKNIFRVNDFKVFLKANGYDYKPLSKIDVETFKKQMMFYFDKKLQKDKADLKLRLLLDDSPEGY